MGVGAGLYMYVVVVQKFTFAISSPDEFLYFKTKIKTNTIFHVRETPRDEDQGLETTSLLYILHTTQFHLFISAKEDMFSSLFVCPFVC